MQIIIFLIVVSLIIASGFLAAFFWAVRDGQYEDGDTPSMRLLVDDDMLLPLDMKSENNPNTHSQSGNK